MSEFGVSQNPLGFLQYAYFYVLGISHYRCLYIALQGKPCRTIFSSLATEVFHLLNCRGKLDFMQILYFHFGPVQLHSLTFSCSMSICRSLDHFLVRYISLICQAQIQPNMSLLTNYGKCFVHTISFMFVRYTADEAQYCLNFVLKIDIDMIYQS